MTCFVDVFRPTVSKNRALLFDGLSIVSGSLLLALLAKGAIPLGFTPIPFTLQMIGVLLMGALLGSRKGTLSVLAYIAEGTLGLPVFAPGSAGLLGPTAGYLIGFVLCAYLVGFLLERGWRHHYLLTVLAMSVGTAVTLLAGGLYLSLFVGIKKGMLLGVVPFLAGDLVKIALSAALVPSGWRLVRIFKNP